MKIVIVNDYLDQAGGGTAMARFMADGLVARGHEVSFISGVAAPASTSLWRTYALGLTDVRTLHPIIAAVVGIFRPSSIGKMLAALRVIGPTDAVIVHQWTRVLSPAVFVALMKRRTFILAHDYFAACPNGAYFNFKSRKVCTLSPLGLRCLTSACDRESGAHKAIRVLRQLGQKALFAAMRNANLVFVSEGQAQKFAHIFPHSLRQRILNNVPPRSALARPHVPIDDRHTLIFVGRLVDEKGPAELAKAGRKANVLIRFIGDGPARPALEAAYPDHEFTGWRDGDYVRSAVREARALIIPSLWAETSVLSAWEGIADGTALAVSDRLCTTAALEAMGGAEVFDPSDECSFSDLLRRIVSDDWAAIMHRADQLAVDEHAMKERYFDTLEAMIQEGTSCASL